MKLSWGFILSSIYCSASAAAASRAGHVFTWDPPSVHDARPPTSTVTPETARLILAQRLGLSQFHSIGKASSEDIKLLNQFGGSSQQLFGRYRDRNNAHALIWVDGVEDVEEELFSQSGFRQLAISSPPATSANERFVQDILLQAQYSSKMADPSMKAYKSTLFLETEMRQLAEPLGTTPYIFEDRLAILRIEQDSIRLTPSLRELMSKVQRQAQSDGFSFTFMIMPPSTSHTKRSANPYGTYNLPSNEKSARREKEAPILSSPSAPETSQVAQNVSVNNLEDFPKIQATEVPEAPVGILRNCFESLSVCQKQTNNCTGHGACYLARKDCYSCQCKATIVGSGDGKKTTNWGGPACQKKDITVPFWLFVGSTVILVFLVGSGIGMLYSMGSEELPSVIGAGVSGPARK